MFKVGDPVKLNRPLVESHGVEGRTVLTNKGTVYIVLEVDRYGIYIEPGWKVKEEMLDLADLEKEKINYAALLRSYEMYYLSKMWDIDQDYYDCYTEAISIIQGLVKELKDV